MTMTTIQQINERLKNNEVLILDGAIGTELERLGAPMHNVAWCGEALGSHPDLVLKVHENYIKAGADIITTNTYASGLHALKLAGLEDKFEPWNRKAIQIAKEARDQFADDRPVAIAGSVSIFRDWGEVDAEFIRMSCQRHAGLLAESGVDLILLEMLGMTVEKIIAALESVLEAGLPVWVSLSCAVDRTSGEVFLGGEESQAYSETRLFYEPFGQAIEQVMAVGGSALLMMHSDLKVTQSALKMMKAHYQGPIGAYPNAGYWQRPQWAFVDQVTPEAYLAEATQWVQLGGQIVGGCCGIGPDHIRALRQGWPN